MAVNGKGVFLGTKLAIPELRKAGGGSIINISSIYGIVGSETSAPTTLPRGRYASSPRRRPSSMPRRASGSTRYIPGFVDSPMTAAAHALPEVHDLRIERTPLGRMGTPEDIAAGILYLASDESSFVTGSELVIDGGMTAR